MVNYLFGKRIRRITHDVKLHASERIFTGSSVIYIGELDTKLRALTLGLVDMVPVSSQIPLL